MAAPDEIYVYGSGGHGKVVAAVLEAGGLKPKGFLDDDPRRLGVKVSSFSVIGDLNFLKSRMKKNSALAVIIGIGNNAERKRVFNQLDELGVSIVSAVHPCVASHESVRIGKGTVVMAGAVINVDTRIGENVIVNTSASIDHDCIVESHVHLAPGVVLAGNVVVGEGAFLGAGSCVIPGITVGAYSIVGAGAVVLEDVSPGSKVVGIPAKPMARI